MVWQNRARLPLKIDGEEAWRCPRRPIKDDPAGWERLMFYFGLFKKGHLVDDGAITGQSAYCMKVFRILDAMVNEVEQDKIEQSKRGRPTPTQAPQQRPIPTPKGRAPVKARK